VVFAVMRVPRNRAGKTTLAYVVKSDRLAVFPPTLHPETEEVTIGDQRFELVDPAMIWRRRRARSSAMQEYARHVHGLIFMVDACDPERFAEAKRELDARPIRSQLSSIDASHAEAAMRDDLLQELIEWDKPILVLGNKIDRPNAVSENTLKTALGLDYCCTGKVRAKRSVI
jgi:GTP-binding protein SAR1